MKQPKLGTTGLTQKEAIFQIVKRIAGDKYRSDVPMKPILFSETEHRYGRARSANCPFHNIAEAVYSGLVDGTIPSIIKSDYERQAYSARIVHYWLKHDSRLNGGQIGSRVAKSEKRKNELKWKLRSDKQLKAFNELLKQDLSNEDILEIGQHTMGRTFKIILEVYGVNLSEFSPGLLRDLKVIDTVDEKKLQAA
jgi:hypothetical protein